MSTIAACERRAGSVVVVVVAAVVALAGCDPLPDVAPPAPPQLGAVTSPTRALDVEIYGAKQASTGVRLGGEELVALDERTQFRAQLALAAGDNELSFTTFDGAGRASEPRTLVIVVDNTPPAPPSFDAAPALTTAASLALAGGKETGSVVWLNGLPLAPGDDDETTWSAAVELVLGENTFRATAVDALGNESDAVELVVARRTLSFTVDPTPAATNATPLAVTGERGAGVSVWLAGIEVLPAAAAWSTWRVDVPLLAGTNSIALEGKVGDDALLVTRTVVYDTDPPAAPTVDALPALVTDCQVSLSGTKESGAGIVVDGVARLAPASGTAYAGVVAAVPPGSHVLDVRAVDRAGNVGAPATPAPLSFCDPLGIYFVVDPVAAIVASSPLALTGLRAGDVDVELDGVVAAAADGSTTWSADVALDPDVENVIALAGVTAAGRKERTVTVFYAASAPAAPGIEAPLLAQSSPVVVTGDKPPFTAVLFGAGGLVPVVPLDESVTWSHTVALVQGDNTLAYRTRDAFGRDSAPAFATLSFDATLPTGTLASPPSGSVHNVALVVTGTTADDVGTVDEVRVCVGLCSDASHYVVASGTASYSAVVDPGTVGGGAAGARLTVDVRADTEHYADTAVSSGAVLWFPTPLAAQSSPLTHADTGTDLEVSAAGYAAVYEEGGGVFLLRDDVQDGFSPAAQSLASGGASAPRVALDGDVAHAVFLDDNAGVASLTHVVYGGATRTVVAGASGSSVKGADIARGEGGELAVVLVREDGAGGHVVESASFDGASWSAPITLDARAPGVVVGAPRAAVTDDGWLHAVWRDDDDVRYARIDLAGGTAEAAFVVNDAAVFAAYVEGVARAPSVVAHGSGRVMIAWADTGYVGADPFVDVVLLATATGGALDAGSLVDAALVGGRGNGSEPALCARGGSAVIAWVDDGDIDGSGSDRDVVVRDVSGGIPGAHRVVSTSARASVHPSPALDASGNVLVLWQEQAALDQGHLELFVLAAGAL